MAVRYVEPKGCNMWITFASLRRSIAEYPFWEHMIPPYKCVKSSPQDCGEFVETVENNRRSPVVPIMQPHWASISAQRHNITETGGVQRKDAKAQRDRELCIVTLNLSASPRLCVKNPVTRHSSPVTRHLRLRQIQRRQLGKVRQAELPQKLGCGRV